MSFACNILRALGFCLLLAAYLNAQPSPYRYFGQQPGERYGSAVAFLGDIDGDGDNDIAVGAHRDDNGGSARGAVWILFLNSDGTVKVMKRSAPPKEILIRTRDTWIVFDWASAL